MCDCHHQEEIETLFDSIEELKEMLIGIEDEQDKQTKYLEAIGKLLFYKFKPEQPGGRGGL